MPCKFDSDDAIVLRSLNSEEEQNIHFLKHPCTSFYNLFTAFNCFI